MPPRERRPCKYCKTAKHVRIVVEPGCCVVVCDGCGTEGDRKTGSIDAWRSWNHLHGDADSPKGNLQTVPQGAVQGQTLAEKSEAARPGSGVPEERPVGPENRFPTAMYQVGIPGELKDDDPEFADLQNAIDCASQWHWNLDHDQPIAIWTDEGAFLYLYFDGYLFQRQ